MTLRTTLPAIAILATSVVLPLAAPQSAVAEACLAAPKGQSPAGSHWFYRLERPSMRKCWRLVATGEEKAAPRTASRSVKQDQRAQKPAEDIEPQGDLEDESAEAPAPTPPAARAAPPQITMVQTKPAAAQPQLAQAPAAETQTTSASEAQLPLLIPSADTTPRAENAAPAPVQTVQAESAPAVITEQPSARPLPTSARDKAAQSEGTSVLHWLPAILALLGLAGGAIFYVARMRRRRSDVLTVLQNTDSPTLDPSAEPAPMPDEPTFAPLPPMGAASREDDVEEALRRFSQNWKRRAA